MLSRYRSVLCSTYRAISLNTISMNVVVGKRFFGGDVHHQKQPASDSQPQHRKRHGGFQQNPQHQQNHQQQPFQKRQHYNNTLDEIESTNNNYSGNRKFKKNFNNRPQQQQPDQDFQRDNFQSRDFAAKKQYLKYIRAIQAAGNNSKKVDAVFDEIKSNDLELTSNIFCTALASCTRSFPQASSSRLDEIMDIAKNNGVKMDIALMNAALTAYGRVGDLKKAQQIYQQICDGSLHLRPDVITYTTMVAVYSSPASPSLPRAEQVVQQMISNGIKPNLKTYTSLISACANSRPSHLSKAVAYFEEMQGQGISPSVYTYNSLMFACARSETPDVGRAISVLKQMEDGGTKPTEATITALMIAHARATPPDVKKTENFLRDMGKMGIEPSRASFSALMMAYERVSPLTEDVLVKADALIKEMREFGIEPKASMYNTLLAMFGKTQPINVKAVEQQVHSMIANGISPNDGTFHVLAMIKSKLTEEQDQHQITALEKSLRNIEFNKK